MLRAKPAKLTGYHQPCIGKDQSATTEFASGRVKGRRLELLIQRCILVRTLEDKVVHLVGDFECKCAAASHARYGSQQVAQAGAFSRMRLLDIALHACLSSELSGCQHHVRHEDDACMGPLFRASSRRNSSSGRRSLKKSSVKRSGKGLRTLRLSMLRHASAFLLLRLQQQESGGLRDPARLSSKGG